MVLQIPGKNDFKTIDFLKICTLKHAKLSAKMIDFPASPFLTAESAEVAEKFSDWIYRIKECLKKNKQILFIMSKKRI